MPSAEALAALAYKQLWNTETQQRSDGAKAPPGLLLPEAGGLVVSKLPPIHDNVDLRPTIPVCYQHQHPTSNCMSYDQKPGERLMSAEKAKVYPKGTLPPAVRKQREPKFVPYEPYKASPPWALATHFLPTVTGSCLLLGKQKLAKSPKTGSRRS